MKRLTTDNTTAIRIWDVEYEFWIEIRLEKAIAVARAAYRKLRVSSQ
jgi:hypothetical protein